MRETCPTMVKYRTARLRIIITIAATIIGIITTVAMSEFILEETIQNQVFACSTYREAGHPRMVAECAKEVERIANTLYRFTNTVGWANPISNHAYKAYAKASVWQARSFEAWAKKYWDNYRPAFIPGVGLKEAWTTDQGVRYFDADFSYLDAAGER